LKPQLTACPSLANRMNTDFCAFEATHPLGASATLPLARLVGRRALSLLVAGMSLLPHRFAPAIPPKRTVGSVQLRFQGYPKPLHSQFRPQKHDPEKAKASYRGEYEAFWTARGRGEVGPSG